MADEKKYLSKIVKGSDTLYIKDLQAWSDIEEIRGQISGGMHYLGKSSTEIEDGDATGPWTIDGVVYVPSGATGQQKNLAAGDIAIYGEYEFIWSGAAGKWQEFGSSGSLGALAFKDSASGSYTPAGTNQASAVSFTGQTSASFVNGFNDDAVAPSFSEGAFTPASLGTGFYSEGSAPTFTEGAFTQGTLPSFTEGTFTPASLAEGFVTAGTAASYSHSGFSGGSLGEATTGNFNTDAEKSTYDEANETLTLAAATTAAAVTAQGAFTPAAYGTDTFDGGTPTAIDTTKFSGGSKAADTWNAGTLPTKAADSFSAGTMTTLDLTKFNGGSKAADTFSAGSAATPTTANAITAVGTGEAAAQTFTGTEGTVTVS